MPTPLRHPRKQARVAIEGIEQQSLVGIRQRIDSVGLAKPEVQVLVRVFISESGTLVSKCN